MPTTVWVATANIHVGAGSSYVLAYTPGNRVPDSVVASLGLAGSGLVQTATIADDGTSPNWKGTDLVTQAELDALLAALPGGSAAVVSVNGEAGAVTLTGDDIPDGLSRFLLTAAERTKLAAVASGATANATDAQLRDRSTHTGTQPAATISDLTETVQDIVGALIVAGTNTTVTYNDAAGTFTINATASGGGTTDAEIVRDTIGAALVAGSGVQITVNDAGDTITVASTAVLPARQVIAGTGLTGGGDLSADRTLAVAYGTAAGTAAQGNDSRLSDARTPTAHTHPASDISNSTVTGRSVLTASDAAAARSAIGAGTASTKADVGLGSVDNTADTAKPVSTAQQTALDAKLTRVQTKRTVSGAYTLVAADAVDTILHSTAASAVTITLPQDTAVTIAQEIAIPWRQYGAGRITFAAGTGATLVSRGSVFKSNAQYSEGVVTKVAANTWLLSGDIAA